MKNIKIPTDVFIRLCKYFIDDKTTEKEKNENENFIKIWLWDKIERMDKHFNYNKTHTR